MEKIINSLNKNEKSSSGITSRKICGKSAQGRMMRAKKNKY